jgi:hypothetical protein
MLNWEGYKIISISSTLDSESLHQNQIDNTTAAATTAAAANCCKDNNADA